MALTLRDLRRCPACPVCMMEDRNKLNKDRRMNIKRPCSCKNKRPCEHYNYAESAPIASAEFIDLEIDPRTISLKSHHTYRHRCSFCSYESLQSSRCRVSSGIRCASCAGRIVTEMNCLETVRPDLVSTLVDKRKAKEVTRGSNEKLLWKCTNNLDHKPFLMMVKNKTLGQNCPECDPTRKKTHEEYVK